MISLSKKKQLLKQVTTAKLKAKAQTIFNKWIRNRDADKPCVSCGKYQIECASHFYSAGHYSHLRFDEDNVWGSCVKCNYYLSGNLIPYRIELEKRIGKERLQLLDAKANHKGYNKNDRFKYELIISQYKLK